MNNKGILLMLFLQLAFVAGLSAQIKTELFEEKTFVKTTPSQLPIVAQLELFDEFPILQNKISEFLFNEKNTSIKEAYEHYKEKMEGVSLVNKRDPKEIITGRLFDLHKIFEKAGVFVCFEATVFETQSYAGHKSKSDKSICIMYDILHNKVLSLEDIFVPNTAKYLRSRLDNGEVSILFIDFGETSKVGQTIKDIIGAYKISSKSTFPALHYGNRHQVKHMEFESNRKFFTSSFNELVDAVLKKDKSTKGT